MRLHTTTRALAGSLTLAAAAVLTGCYAAPTTTSFTIASKCVKNVLSGPVGGIPTDTTTTNLPDQTITVSVAAPDWVTAKSTNFYSDTFPVTVTISGFTAVDIPVADATASAGIYTDASMLSDPHAPDSTDVAADPNAVDFSTVFSAPLPAAPGGPITYRSTAGTPFPVVMARFLDGHTYTYGPATLRYGGMSAAGPAVVVGTTQSVTSVLCVPKGPVSEVPLVTITPHVMP